MRFLKQTKNEKIILVISDLHLGAGQYVKNKKNHLEDFLCDQELVDFLKYYSSGIYKDIEVELIINGDFLDFLAVPYVEFFDTEFWSEEASLAKLEIMIEAHKEVFEGLDNFLSIKNKKITYMIGNHDAELLFDSVRETVLKQFKEDNREKFKYLYNVEEYRPENGIVVKHGHTYEPAHNFDLDKSIVETESGKKYFLPPWGSYYVTRVVNKFKVERDFINQIRPIKSFIIYGLIFDTLFTIRFIFANCYYFIMVRFLMIFKEHDKIKDVINYSINELELFKDYEELTRDFFEEDKNSKVLIVGHTHKPTFKVYPNGNTFINTGTWTKMQSLDFSHSQNGLLLTYACIEIKKKNEKKFSSNLYVWKGENKFPFIEY